MCLSGNNPQSILADIFNYYKNHYYPFSHFFLKNEKFIGKNRISRQRNAIFNL